MTGLKQNAALGNDITSSHRGGVPRLVRESILGQLKQESRRWPDGTVDEAIFHQPNGTFLAQRNSSCSRLD
jgi:hypothetical protein